MAEQNFAALTMGMGSCCRHVKAVEEEYMSREHKMDIVMKRIIISAADGDNDDTSESTV